MDKGSSCCFDVSSKGKRLLDRLNDYLKSDIYSDILFSKEFVSLRNKIVHQRYVATEKEALEFMDFVKEIYENVRRK